MNSYINYCERFYSDNPPKVFLDDKLRNIIKNNFRYIALTFFDHKILERVNSSNTFQDLHILGEFYVAQGIDLVF